MSMAMKRNGMPTSVWSALVWERRGPHASSAGLRALSCLLSDRVLQIAVTAIITAIPARLVLVIAT